MFLGRGLRALTSRFQSRSTQANRVSVRVLKASKRVPQAGLKDLVSAEVEKGFSGSLPAGAI